MKIGFVLPFASINYSGGINVQARMWRDGLIALGHEAYLISHWEKYDYNSFDYIIILGCGKILGDYAKLYKKFQHIKLISAPIIDFKGSLYNFKIRSKFLGCEKMRFITDYNLLYTHKDKFDLFLARSEYEKVLISEGLGINRDNIKIVPISMRFDIPTEVKTEKKKPYCFHVSRLANKGKNVERLVKAAQKYNFQLKLAGTVNGEEKTWLDNLIKGSNNIEYLGYLSDEKLKEIYQEAKVFALPSLIEGVGMVALEAAVYGCEIVLTEIGAPKEYYDGKAVLVNPYNVDSIGKGILEALHEKKSQPDLRRHILSHYTIPTNVKQLETFLKLIN